MSLLDLIPDRIVDQNAMTVAEIAKAKRLSESQTRHYTTQWVKEGTAEKVFKMVGERLMPAYRLKRDKKPPISGS